MWMILGEERQRLGVLRYCKAHELLILPEGQEDKRLNTKKILRNFESFNFCKDNKV